MLAACFGRPCGPWRARPRLPWPPLAAPPCKALCLADKANMRPLAKKCKPFFDIFSNFLFLPYILGVYKRTEPRQQGGKRPQTRPIGRALSLARGHQREQGRGLLGMGRGAPAWARLRAYAPACPRAWGRACACACACGRLRAHARPYVRACLRMCLRVPAPACQALALSRKRSRKGEECARQTSGRGRGPGGRFSTIYKCLRRTKQLFQSVSKHAKRPPRKNFSKLKGISLLFLAVYAMQNGRRFI